jgi:hypothetical protein
VLRKLATIGAAVVLGGGAALGVAACGEKRGNLKIEGDSGTGTGTTGTSTTGTAETSTTKTSKTTTSP